jgi:nucleotide-binding universal stress UspA family protein
MKKILLICDANNFPSGAFKFLKLLHFSDPFLLTGAFFHSVNYDLLIPSTFAFSPDPLIAYTNKDNKSVANSIKQFSERCNQSGIEFRVHEESEEFKISDVIKESRFADLIVMSEELFCADLDVEQPNYYMEEVMHKAECPVLLIPENYKPFSHVTIAYDGRKESLFAMKQFCYLFPLTKYSTTVLYLTEKEEQEIPELIYLEEYAARHFGSLTIEKKTFNKKSEFIQYVGNKNETLLIAGAYGRSGLSNTFHESFVEKTIREHKVPVFIAHHS